MKRAPDGEHPVVSVMVKNEEKLFRPEEVSAVILQKMKDIAKHTLGFEPEKAIITVPAYF